MVKFSGGNGKPFISKRQKDLSEKMAMWLSNHEAFSGKNILLASTKPPWTNTPDNFEDVS